MQFALLMYLQHGASIKPIPTPPPPPDAHAAQNIEDMELYKL